MATRLPQTFSLKVKGMTFRSVPGPQPEMDYPQVLLDLPLETFVYLKRDPDNPVDPQAVGVWITLGPKAPRIHLGYIPRPVSERIAAEMDAGDLWLVQEVEVLVTPGRDDIPGLSLFLHRGEPGQKLHYEATHQRPHVPDNDYGFRDSDYGMYSDY